MLDAGPDAHRRQLGVDDRREVEAVSEHRVDRVLGLDDLDLHAEVGTPRAQVASSARQQARGQGREGADAHGRPAGARRLANLLLGTPCGVEQGGRPGEQQLAGGRGMHAACVTIQQPDADDRLQARDVLGDRGLRVAQDGGRVAERPPQRDLTKRRQELEIEHHEP